MTRKWGRAYDAWYAARVIWQKAHGLDGETCEKCHSHEDRHGVKALIVAHPNGYDSSKVPTIEDIALWHQSCNIRADPPNQGPRDVPLRERDEEADARPQGYQYSAGEPKKHDIMRDEWDRWVRGKGRSQFCLFASLKKGEWAWVTGSEIANDAPWALGVERPLGSSETYWRFINEDSSESANILEKEYKKGEVWVRYTRFFLENILDMAIDQPLQLKEKHLA